MSEVFRIQPYSSSPSAWTTNSLTAYAVWPGSNELPKQERDDIQAEVAAVDEIESCNWDDEGRLLLVRVPDLTWGAQGGVGEQVCEAVSAYLGRPLRLEMGKMK